MEEGPSWGGMLGALVSLTGWEVSPQCAGSQRQLGKYTAARTQRLAGGRGRQACCTVACTSVELSSSTPTGWCPLPTAFTSEFSFLGVPRERLAREEEPKVAGAHSLSSGACSGQYLLQTAHCPLFDALGLAWPPHLPPSTAQHTCSDPHHPSSSTAVASLLPPVPEDIATR